MATLTNTKIKDTYDGLLKTTDNEALDASGVTLIEDGLGNASALSVGRSGNGVTVTGNLAVDTNTLYVDAANNRVGIGRTPSYKLDVADFGGSDVTIHISSNQTASGILAFGDNAAAARGYVEYDHVTNNLILGTTATERMRIDSSGNVGIGISNPDSYDGNADNLVIGSTGANDRNGITIVGGDTDGRGAIYFADTTENSAGFLTYFHSNNSMLFGTSDTTRMTIDSSGNVGIGVVPKSWSTAGGTKALQISTRGALFEAFDNVFLSNNAYYDGSERYIETNVAARLGCNSTGNIVFENAASGTAGSVLTWNERMRITSGGDVLVGITTAGATGGTTIKEGVSSTDYTFQINGSSTNQAKCISISSGQLTASHGMMNFSLANPGNGRFINFNAPDGGYTYADRGYIELSGTSVLYSSVSDYRLKENVVELTGALDRVDALKPSRFNFIGDDETIDGFIAHEVKEVVPQAVSGEKDAVDEEGNPIYQGIDQSKIVPLLVGAIKELRAEIELLKSQLS